MGGVGQETEEVAAFVEARCCVGYERPRSRLPGETGLKLPKARHGVEPALRLQDILDGALHAAEGQQGWGREVGLWGGVGVVGSEGALTR